MANIVNQAQTRVSVDGQSAEQELSKLEVLAREYRDRMVEASKAGDKKAFDKAAKELKKVDKEMRNIIRSSFDVNKVMNNLSTSGPNELKKALTQLNKELNSGKVARGSKEWDELQRKIKAVRSELNKINSESQLTQSRWSKMTDGFNKYFGVITTVLASITGLSFAFRKMAEDVAKMDDMYSDVMKTTQMTREEVVGLNEDLKKINTRTAREELNKIAEEGGRIGIAKDEILEFVKAMDISNVALGDSFQGGASEIANTLGKLKFLFKETQDMGVEKAYLSIGSAINELGANGIASEVNIANFTTRMGSLPGALKPSIASTLALGAAFEESGIEAEIASRGYGIFISRASTKSAQFAKVMGITKKEVENLINTNPLEFFLKFSEGMKGMSATDVSKTLNSLKVNADGVNKIIGAAASNTERFRELIDLSNKSFADGTSVITEFDLKNNNLKATLDKGRKAFSDAALELGERLNPALLQSTNLITYLVKVLPAVIDFFSEYGKIILYVTGLITSYIVGVKLAVYWETAKNAVLAISKMRLAEKALAQAIATGNTTRAAVAERLYAASMAQSSVGARAYIAVVSLLSAAKYLLTGNITKARQAMQAFSLSLKLNPAALGITAILGLVAAFGYLLVKVNNTVTAQKAIKEATKDLNTELVKEQSNANKLFEALKRVNPESEDYKKIKDAIIKLYGPYLQGLIDEKGNLTDIAKAQEIVNTKIRESISLKIKNAATSIIQEDSIKNQLSDLDDVMKAVDDQLKYTPNYSKEASNAIRENINKTISEAIASGKTGMVELTKAIKDVVEWEGVDIRQKTGFLEPTSLYMQISALSSGVHNSQKEIKKVEEQFSGMISQAAELNALIGNTGGGNNDDDNNNDDTKPDKVTEQRKKVQDAMRKLEITYNDEISAIKKKFRSGEIKEEFDFNNQLLEAQFDYDQKRIEQLNKLKKAVSDPSVQDEILKQISEINNAILDREIKRQADLKRIILNADPAKAEQEAYDIRLKELGLFGETSQTLTEKIAKTTTGKEKALLQEKYTAFELLAKQHEEKMSKIEKPEVKIKLKALEESQSAEESLLAERRAKGLISERLYKSQLLLLDIKYTSQKLSIDGTTEEQRLQLLKESQDKQAKYYEETAGIRERLNKKTVVENLEQARAMELAMLDENAIKLENEEQYRQMVLAINEKYDLLEQEQDKVKREQMLQTVQFYLDSVQELMNAYSSFVRASNEAETASINKRYESQIKAAGNNSKRVKKLEEQRDKELSAANKKAEDRSFKIQIAMAIASTFQSAINAYSSTAAIPIIGPALAPIAAGVAAAAGMINVAAIKKQHDAAMANYWVGGYTDPGRKYDVAGLVHKGEFVGNAQAVNNPYVRRVFDVVDQAQRTNTVSGLKSHDFASALEYNERVAQFPAQSNQIINTEMQQQNEYLINVLADVAATNKQLKDRLDEPFNTINSVTGPDGIKQAMDTYNRLINNKSRG